MTLGKGTIYGTSQEQHFNTQSSTKAELVTIDDSIAQIMWTYYFLKAQGYTTSFFKTARVQSFWRSMGKL